MNSNLKKTESSFLFKGQKKEFLDWLESLRISRYWLDTMSHADSYALCKEIQQVLKNFKELDLIEKEKLFSLIEINSCLQGIYEKLHNSYLDGKLPLDKEKQESVEIVINTYLELANAYAEIIATKKNKLSEQHLALNACKGLQALGVVIVTVAEVYTSPPKGFWLLCYRLFKGAEELSLLDNKVKIDNAIYSAAILFKQLIVFYIIDKHHLAASEIGDLFQLLFRGINYIQSYILALIDLSANSTSKVFGFTLDKDEPPTMQDLPLATAKLLRYVEKSEIIKIMQFLLHEAKENQLNNSVNPELFSRILTTLEYQKNKHQRRINKQYSCRAIVGLDNLIDFLLEKEEKKSLDSNKKQNLQFDDEMDSFQMILDWNSETDSSENNEKSVIIENLQIVDSSMSGYGIHWNNKIIGKLQIGEVIGIIPGFNSSRKGIETGLIRRINVSGNEIVFGVELIGLESTLIHIERPDNPASGEWALFLFGSPNYDVGVLCHKQRNYQAGETIFIQASDKKHPCHLGVVLNATPLLEHFTLLY